MSTDEARMAKWEKQRLATAQEQELIQQRSRFGRGPGIGRRTDWMKDKDGNWWRQVGDV